MSKAQWSKAMPQFRGNKHKCKKMCFDHSLLCSGHSLHGWRHRQILDLCFDWVINSLLKQERSNLHSCLEVQFCDLVVYIPLIKSKHHQQVDFAYLDCKFFAMILAKWSPDQVITLCVTVILITTMLTNSNKNQFPLEILSIVFHMKNKIIIKIKTFLRNNKK